VKKDIKMNKSVKIHEICLNNEQDSFVFMEFHKLFEECLAFKQASYILNQVCPRI
jgi:hypothetical protein